MDDYRTFVCSRILAAVIRLDCLPNVAADYISIVCYTGTPVVNPRGRGDVYHLYGDRSLFFERPCAYTPLQLIYDMAFYARVRHADVRPLKPISASK